MSKLNLEPLNAWNPPSNWMKIRTLDAHCAGEPLRIILSGIPHIPGKTILEKRQYALKHIDNLRRFIMLEPRGHSDMYGCILVEPTIPDADFSMLFMHNEGFSTMCGHGIIAMTTVAVETNLIPLKMPTTTILFETPAGIVRAFADIESGRVTRSRFRNVPSFVLARDQLIDIPGIGEIKYDIAFGGAFYALVAARDLGISMIPDEIQRIIDIGMQIKRTIQKQYPVEHPEHSDLSFLYGTIFTGESLSESADSRNVCIFADGEVDRSPTGTGVSARLALLYAKNELGLGETITIESIIGTRFSGSIIAETTVGTFESIIPEISGKATIIGKHEFILDPEDDIQDGFILGPC